MAGEILLFLKTNYHSKEEEKTIITQEEVEVIQILSKEIKTLSKIY